MKHSCSFCDGEFDLASLLPQSADPMSSAVCRSCAAVSILRDEMEEWRKGVALVYAAVGETNPVGLCCVTLAEKVLAIRAENEQLRTAPN